MATRSNSKSFSNLQSDFGDEIGVRAVAKQPLVLGERNERNAKEYDAIKGNEAAFQKVVAIMSEWQDGVHDGLKIAFRDAYRELPQSVKDVITEPREKMKGLYRGFETSKSEVLKNLKEEYEDTYERLVARLERVQERESSTEEQIKAAEDRITETEIEERQRYKDFEKASTINGWTPSYMTAKKFGQYVLTADDVEDFEAIVSTRKVVEIMKSVFKEDSISKDYQGGLHRMWADTEQEYIVMGVKIAEEAQELKESWRDKNIEWQSKREERERERYGE